VIELKQNTADGKYIVHKLPGNRKPPTITLKRGKNSSKTCGTGTRRSSRQGLRRPEEGSVVLYNYDHSEVGATNFVNAWPSKVSMSSSRPVERGLDGGSELSVRS